jgi:hypothetical protein
MVFFASLDQRSAGGEGACTLCCVALAEWLEANPGQLPTSRLDALPDASQVGGQLEKKPDPEFVEPRTLHLARRTRTPESRNLNLEPSTSRPEP